MKKLAVDLRKLKLAFYSQRCTAAGRGIAFLLSFEEWLKIWQRSGHLHERGRCKGQYQMARFGDKGPYAVGNVKIITGKANKREYQLGRPITQEARQKISQSQKGKVIPLSSRRRMSRAHKGKTLSSEHRKHIAEAVNGAGNPNAKLTWRQAASIRKDYKEVMSSGCTDYDARHILATQYDVGSSTIWNVVRNKNYVRL